MNEKKIVAVQFKSKADPTGFGGREYTYYSTVDLAVGDVIVVPTKRGDGTARVSRVDVKASEIDVRVEPYMKTIEEIVHPAEEQKCRVCGCTQERACPGGCYWVEPTLCSTCADKEGHTTSEL